MAKSKKTEAAAAPAEKAEKKGRRSSLDPTAKITVLAEKNPKREGTGAHDRFAKYKNGMTVEKALAAGMKPGNVLHDVKKGYISIAA